MFFDHELLSELILPLKLENAFVSHWTIRGRWSFEGPSEPLALLHYVAQGQLFIETQCGDKVAINQGDLVIFPHGAAHRIGDSEERSSSIPLDKILPHREPGNFARIDIPGNSKLTEILCAGLHYSTNSSDSIYDLLPEILVVRKEEMSCQPLLSGILHGIVQEMHIFENGKQFTLNKGLELAHMLGIRTAMGIEKVEATPRNPIINSKIQRSLVYMHRNFDRRTKIADIATTVGMSRSAFSHAFREATGHTPAKYLSSIRIFEALRLMDTTKLNKEEIAYRVGFESSTGLYLAIKSHRKIDNLRTNVAF